MSSPELSKIRSGEGNKSHPHLREEHSRHRKSQCKGPEVGRRWHEQGGAVEILSERQDLRDQVS